jgi:carboxylesterase
MTQVKPACERFAAAGGPTGVWLQHGFSGCPASMRPMAEWLAAQGLTVSAPLLPGHGTTWKDLETVTLEDWEREAEAALADLVGRCDTVVGVGLSMGGAMVLHMAARHPGQIAGVAVVNPNVYRRALALAPVVRLFARSVKGVGNDIKKPGQNEEPYDRIPVRSLSQLHRLYRTVQRELPAVQAPVLVFSAPEDHLVKPANSRYVLDHVGSSRKELIPVPNSYHVATLDFDAELIFQRVLDFALSLAAERRGTT